MSETEPREISEKAGKALIRLELKRRMLEAKFEKARKKCRKEIAEAWDCLDETLMAIEEEQKKGIGLEDDKEKEWAAERLDYVAHASDGHIKYNQKCDAAYDIFESKWDKLKFDLDDAFDAFYFDEEDVIDELETQGWIEADPKSRKRISWVVQEQGKRHVINAFEKQGRKWVWITDKIHLIEETEKETTLNKVLEKEVEK